MDIGFRDKEITELFKLIDKDPEHDLPVKSRHSANDPAGLRWNYRRERVC